MSGKPKTTKGSGSAKFFPRGNHSGGGNPPSLKTEIVAASARRATPSQTVAKGQFGNPSGKTGASPPSRLNGQGIGIGAAKLYQGDYSTLTKAKPYGKVRVR